MTSLALWETENSNIAPFPQELADLVGSLEYRKGWRIALRAVDRGQGSKGLTLCITTLGVDSYHPERGETYRVIHYMPVPPASYNRRSWQRWLLDQIILVETHEACEFFKIGGKRPFAPHHGPGWNPYTIFEHGSELDARTRFTGEVLKRTEDIT